MDTLIQLLEALALALALALADGGTSVVGASVVTHDDGSARVTLDYVTPEARSVAVEARSVAVESDYEDGVWRVIIGR